MKNPKMQSIIKHIEKI